MALSAVLRLLVQGNDHMGCNQQCVEMLPLSGTSTIAEGPGQNVSQTDKFSLAKRHSFTQILA